ncbi:MAG TPA: hypothetical protein VNJ01_12515 [Bacteriovoracaceae bacterium]|nr:hypothetical protein [Bacteriovoracaceae bacterium]
MSLLKRTGQATVEYAFILAFAIFLGFKATNKFTDFFRDSMGNVGHVLSTHLTVGICPSRCWFSNYVNSFGQP